MLTRGLCTGVGEVEEDRSSLRPRRFQDVAAVVGAGVSCGGRAKKSTIEAMTRVMTKAPKGAVIAAQTVIDLSSKNADRQRSLTN